jgi:spore germination protein GerM
LKSKTVLLAAALALVLIGAAAWGTMWILRQPVPPASTDVLLPEGEAPLPPMEPEEADDADEPSEGRIQVTLYVLARSGRELATETQQVRLEGSLQQQAKEVVRMLLRRSAAIPRGVELRELFITSQGVAYVDLSQEVVSNHPGGSSAEELTVFSLTHTLVANFPAIKNAKILVEGREIQTIAGHLDLSIPYGRAPLYLRPPSERSESSNETS